MIYYFKHIGKHMTECESIGTENMYNFANVTWTYFHISALPSIEHQQATNIKKNLYIYKI